MHAPPAGVSVGTHITKVPLVPFLSNQPTNSSIQLSILSNVDQSIYPSIHPFFPLLLFAAAAVMTSLLENYIRWRLALPPISAICFTVVLALALWGDRKTATQTLYRFVIFFSSPPTESTFLTCLNLLVIVAAKAVLICLPERDRHQHSSSLVSYFLQQPLSHPITC